MSFLKNDSIFDVTGISLTDFTLSFDSEPVPLPTSQGKVEKDSPSKGDLVQKLEDTENKQVGLVDLDPKESISLKKCHDAPSKSEVQAPTECSQLVLAKLAIRHDIMDLISAVLSDLVAIDMKYSNLAHVTKTTIEPRPQAPFRNPGLQVGQTLLDSFHNFTTSELHKQLGSVRNYIQDLDSKYSDVARSIQENISNLEQANVNLTAEVERLRKFY
nr:conserved hypothetical protein [Hymenolepis microstoma]